MHRRERKLGGMKQLTRAMAGFDRCGKRRDFSLDATAGRSAAGFRAGRPGWPTRQLTPPWWRWRKEQMPDPHNNNDRDRNHGRNDPAHLTPVLEGLAQAKRREFATNDEVEAAFRRFDR
jgi:hypothetical protein